jgi:tetratricopeptide (TPR) repeat protein/predicted Ser/Thr protein kinase
MSGETPASIGPYEIVGELGRGGMGVVYRARRADLNREFALKVIRAGEQDEADALQRFRREAQAAAALSDHPGIVGVHDIGDDGGRVFFAMDLVEGESLEEAIDGGELLHAQAAEWIEQAARAVHHAHERGVLHRDLKPGNILIGTDGRARVTDFGLAQVREAGPDVTRLTKSGVVLGTPAYMPPEQTTGGKALDGRADVYALGASLYECLVGEPPFTGDTMIAVLGRVMREEPRAPARRDPRIPAALSVIAIKCLEKDPQRRYQTAQALAEDLARWRRGEAIIAKPPSVAFRAKRWLRRNRAAAVAILAIAVALGSFFGYGAAQQRAATADAAVLTQLRERTGLALRAALSLRRAGQLADMEEYLAETQRACSEAKLEGHPEPHYRLGQMYRALGRWDEARTEQDRALQLDPDHRGALYERVVLRFGAHERRLVKLVAQAQRAAGRAMFLGGEGAQVDLAPKRRASATALAQADAECAKLRAGLFEDLKRLTAPAPAGDGQISEAQLTCAKGLHALLQERFGEARAQLERAVELDARLVAPIEALAALARDGGDVDACVGWWGRGIEADRGYLPFWWGRIRACRQGAALYRAGDPEMETLLQQAEADCLALLKLFDDPAVHAELAYIRWEQGRRLVADLRVRATQYERSLRALQEVLKTNPNDPELLEVLANTQRALGFARMKGTAGTPLPYMQDAIDTYTRLLQMPGGERNIELWHGRSIARRDLAEWRMRAGHPAGTLLEDAQADLDEAVRIDPSLPVLWSARSQLAITRGNRAADEGRDPTALYAAGIQDVREAIRLHSGSPFSWWMLGRLQLAQARYRHNRNRTAERDRFDAAIESFRRSVELSPNDEVLRTTLADAFVSLSKWELSNGQDGRKTLREAITHYDAALALSDALPDPWSGRGRARAALAAELGARGLPRGKLLLQASSDLRRALELEPKRPRLWHALGEVHRTNGMLQPEGSDRAIAAMDEARRALDQAVELSGGATFARFARARILVDGCLHLTARKRDIEPSYRAALADLEAVLAVEESVSAYEIRGRAHINWGSALSRQRKDPAAAYAAAAADGLRMVTLSPKAAYGWRLRAEAVRYLADGAKFAKRYEEARRHYTESIRCYGEGLTLAPDSASALQGRGGAQVNFANMLRGMGEGDAAGRVLDQAVADLSRGVQVGAGNATTWWFLANAHGSRGGWLADQGKDPVPEFELAIKAFEGAIRAAPHMRRTFEKGIQGHRNRIAKAQGK